MPNPSELLQSTFSTTTTESAAVRKFSAASASAIPAITDDALWMRIEAFELDLPDSGLNFTERLAKENAWALSYAARVIKEYKRFLYLALRSGHVACPSEDVDQAWHMHLTYTRSYWNELCANVLQAPLHHGPTQGGSAERLKYYQLYEQTKESYLRLFGVQPPQDIWPAAEKRFGEDLGYVRVNANSHWIIPKLGWKHAALGAGSAGVVLPVAQLAANPLEWTGPQFLVLFISLFVIMTIASYVLTRMLLRNADYDFQPDRSDELGPVELAWLDGGKERVLSCALVELAQAKVVDLDGSFIRPGPNIASYQTTHRIKNLIIQSVGSADAGRGWRMLARDVNVGLVALRQSLEEKGLLLSSQQRSTAIAIILMLLGSVAVLGVAKLWTGISRGRPVGILVVFEILSLLAIAGLIATVPKLTSAGRALLKRLKQDFKESPDRLVGSPDGIDSQEAILLWGSSLIGMNYLMSTPYEEYGAFAQREIANANSATSGGCGATGCSGDVGCGGGGCGGGGCGGCGGCGG